jgi:Uncharacterized conserved protein
MLCPAFEKIMVDNGMRVIKYWLEVGRTSRSGASRPASAIPCGSGS